MTSRIELNRRWWRDRVFKHGTCYFAHVPIPIQPGGPKAHEVEHLFSATVTPGKRHYAFETEAERDKFVADFDATPCTDPCHD